MKNILSYGLSVLAVWAGGLVVGCMITKNHVDKQWQHITGIQSTGYEATLSFDNGLVLYYDGEECSPEYWQSLMEVKTDGKIGYKTIKKAAELNRTDVRRLK